jgi:hypothetical protein
VIGYTTSAEALAHGFTHHGSYFGIPVWIGDLESDCLLVEPKHVALDPLMTLFHWIEGTLHALLYPDVPPVFQFKVMGEIASRERAK